MQKETDISINLKVILALTMVHFTGDFYISFISPLYPAFIEKLGLSLTQVGIIAGVNRFLAFIVQPSVGYLADRYQTRYFMLGGLAICILFIPLSGIAASFWTLLFFICVGSVGNAMFHPSATGMIPLYAGNKSGLFMSVFNTGGTLAFGLGPLFITWYVSLFSLEAVPMTMIIGLASIAFLYFTVPAPQSEGFGQLGFIGTLKETLGHVWKTIVLIWLVMVLRAVVGQSFLTFMPVLYVQKGYSIVSAGLLFSLFTVAGTLSGIIAGYVSDRIGFKPIFYLAHGLMTPALLLFLYLPGHWAFAGSALAGFFVMATLPLGVVMAQSIAPKGRSMVASLMMGLAWGLGGTISPLVGKLADIYSIEAVLWVVAFIPVVTLGLIFFFPPSGRGTSHHV
jgi:MFS transporter, FSR family, fosmidomycin resistance protein